MLVYKVCTYVSQIHNIIVLVKHILKTTSHLIKDLMTSPKCKIYLRVKLVCCQRPKSAVSEYLDIRQLNNPSRRANKKVSLSGKRRNLLKRVPIEGTHAPLCEFRGSSSALFTICVYPKAPYKMMRTYFRCWNVVYPFILAKSA